MLRHGVVLGIGLVFSAPSFAQTSWGPSDNWQMPGKVISQSNKSTKSTSAPIKSVSAKVPEGAEPKGAEPIGIPINQSMGGTSTCSDPATCSSCAKSHKGCWTRFKEWISFRGSPASCECYARPTPYTPPLYTFFPCKPNPAFVHNPNPWKGSCDSKACDKQSSISKVEEPPIAPQVLPTTPQTMPTMPTTPKMMPTTPSTMSMPSRVPTPIQPISPNVPKSTTIIPNTNPSTSTVSRYTPVSMGSASAFAIDQSMEERPNMKQPQPLSVYSSGGSKTCSDTTTSKVVSPPEPTKTSVFDKVWIPGYRRMGGPKE
jgi:hypothetical protein